MMLAALLSACTSAATSDHGTSPSSSSTTSTTLSGSGAPNLLYVSLGDSYAAGYQPTGPHSGHTDTNGFAYQVPRIARKKGYHFELVNFGCGGATTTSILDSVGCGQLGPGGMPYPDSTQAAAAEQFIQSHRGEVGLITVSIGGNDVVPCASEAQPIACVTTAVKTIKTNLATLLKGLRAAAGPGVPIVGTTYPDVILGLYLSKSAAMRSLATLSITAFKDLINPALKEEYQAVGGSFADVTSATGAYGPFTQTAFLPPYGTIPVPVAMVCNLTFYCQYQDIHPRTPGYLIIASLVVGALPEHPST
jgi:lysophospholipase L1-like esterase